MRSSISTSTPGPGPALPRGRFEPRGHVHHVVGPAEHGHPRPAARQGLRAAGAKLMEPMMKVDVTTPEEHMGDVIGDVNSRRGMVIELAERGNMKVVRAKVPLANMFQYVSSLRSMSKGRASYSMELENYEVVPPPEPEPHGREPELHAP